MNYTDKQIENAKRRYNDFLRLRTLKDYDVNAIGITVAEQRMSFDNSLVMSIINGDKELEKEWKLFFLNEEVKRDSKEEAQKAKLLANKEASADILAPIKELKKLGEFGKWLNTNGNKFRNEHFTKKYTQASVNAFLATI